MMLGQRAPDLAMLASALEDAARERLFDGFQRWPLFRAESRPLRVLHAKILSFAKAGLYQPDLYRILNNQSSPGL